MEQITSSLEAQRNAAADQARTGLDVIFAHLDCLPDDKKQSNLINIAWSAAGQGLWDTFTDYYGVDATETFIPNKPEKRAPWVVQFSEGGDFNKAKFLADTIINKEIQRSALMSIGHQAARIGDVSIVFEFTDEAKDSEDKKVKEYRDRIISGLFRTLADQGRWEDADQIFESEKLGTYDLLVAATHAAKQGQLEHVVALVNRAIKQNPDQLKGRGDPDEGDWLRRPIITAAKTAFVNGNYGFIATMSSEIKWPEDAMDDWQGWVTSGVISGVYVSEDFETGIGMFVAMALDAGEDREVYAELQNALDERNWTAIELLAPSVNSEILGMLHRLAYKEEGLDRANYFSEAMRRKDKYEGNYLIISDNVTSTMFNEAKNGNWETALELRGSTLRIFDYNNARELIKLAVVQERYDVLPGLISSDDGLLSRACNLLENRGEFEHAENLASIWISENPDQKSDESLLWFKIGLLTHSAPTAAWLGDWPRALKSLEKMDELTSADNHGHRGYELVAIEALSILHHTTKSQPKY